MKALMGVVISGCRVKLQNGATLHLHPDQGFQFGDRVRVSVDFTKKDGLIRDIWKEDQPVLDRNFEGLVGEETKETTEPIRNIYEFYDNLAAQVGDVEDI